MALFVLGSRGIVNLYLSKHYIHGCSTLPCTKAAPYPSSAFLLPCSISNFQLSWTFSCKFPFVQYSHTVLHTCIDNIRNLYTLFVLWDSLLHNTSHYMNLVQQLLALLFVSCSCRYFREPSYFWTKQLKTIVFVAAKHIENEELFLK